VTIKAVLFDLDDTLLWDERSIEEAFRATCEFAARKYPQIKPDELENSVRAEARALYEANDTFPFTQNIGINPFEGLWGAFDDKEHEQFQRMKAWVPAYRKEAWTRGLKAQGINDAELGEQLAERFPEERKSRPIVYEETYEVLDQLKDDYRLLLLTNGSPSLQNTKLAGVNKLMEYFDHIVISGQFGEGKPSPAIFKYALELLNISNEEGIMVGDKLTTDIKGALSVGLTSVWINRRNLPKSAEIIPDYEIKHLSELHSILASLK
jgi:putative hydrolase of the HAD superfamily